MVQLVLIGLGAGIVSALLFAVVATGSPLGMMLSYAAPLPILIVALGWHHLVGLLAVAIGALATSFALRSSAGLAFALGPAFPAWWLAYLALLGRAGPSLPGNGPAAYDWMLPGRLLLWTGITGGAIALAAAFGLAGGDYALFTETLSRASETLLGRDFGLPRRGADDTIGGVPARSLLRLLLLLMPAVAGSVFALALALNLWLAAKVVSVSGRLPRPWPSIPDLRMPPLALALLAAGILAAFSSGWLGVAGRALTGGLGMMFSLQGLALIHLATRGRPGRGIQLTLAYVFAVLLGHIVLPILAVAGMLDTATALRRRLTRNPEPGGRNGPPSSS